MNGGRGVCLFYSLTVYLVQVTLPLWASVSPSYPASPEVQMCPPGPTLALSLSWGCSAVSMGHCGTQALAPCAGTTPTLEDVQVGRKVYQPGGAQGAHQPPPDPQIPQPFH